MSARLIFFLTLLQLFCSCSVVSAALPHDVPDFAAFPSSGTTRRSVMAGSFTSASTWSGNVVPANDDVVLISHQVHLTAGTTTARLAVVVVNATGVLTFATAPIAGGTRSSPERTTLNVGTVLVHEGGEFRAGNCRDDTSTGAVQSGLELNVVFLNNALRTTGSPPFDPFMWGTGFISFGKVTVCGVSPGPRTFARLFNEATPSSSTITLAEDTAWFPGDELLLPDTRHLRDNQRIGSFSTGQWESVTLSTSSNNGRALQLTTPPVYSHVSARNAQGVRETNTDGSSLFSPHIANLKRTIIFRSETPTGVRGHIAFLNGADVDVRYAAFVDIGRTTNAEIDSTAEVSPGVFNIGSNQIGRYALHFHHVYGPATPGAGGFQFNLIGNVIRRCPKWGVVVHASHYGRISKNIVYDAFGASYITEDGSETENVFEDNMAIYLRGTGSREADADGFGREGSAFWFRGANNIVRRNVATNIIVTGPWGFGFSYALRYTGTVLIPTAKGQLPASYASVNSHIQAVPEFADNEVYGAVQGGITIWWVGSFGDDLLPGSSDSVFRNLKVWHAYGMSFYGYPASKLVFVDWKIRCNKDIIDNRYENPIGLHYGDYMTDRHSVWNADIQGCRIGIDAANFIGPRIPVSQSADRFLTYSAYYDSFLSNWVNVDIETPWSVNGADLLPAKLTILDNVRMEHPNVVCGSCDNGPWNITMNDFATTGANLAVLDELLLINTLGSRRQVHYLAQNGSHPLPETGFVPGGSGRPLVGCPSSGMTNLQCLNAHQITWAGAITPCQTQEAGIYGFVCPTSLCLPRRAKPGGGGGSNECGGITSGSGVSTQAGTTQGASASTATVSTSTTGCRPLTSCPSGRVCGLYPDGCGGSIACGSSCSTYLHESCNPTTNQCECAPHVCSEHGWVCGDHDNGCGLSLTCGPCSSNTPFCVGNVSCQASQCTLAANCPVPLPGEFPSCGILETTCIEDSRPITLNCGTCVPRGRGTVVCDTTLNRCACSPISLQAACANVTCGQTDNGCGGSVDCGDCPCGPNEVFAQGACVCATGFALSSSGTCEASDSIVDGAGVAAPLFVVSGATFAVAFLL